MPPAQPLEMTPRPVRGIRRTKPRERATARELFARSILIVGSIASTVYGTRAMADAVAVGSFGALEIAFVSLFALTFGWIAFSSASALAGLLVPPRTEWPEGDITEPVALVMPVYNEDAAATTAALRAMAEGLIDFGRGADFEIVILSDTNKSSAWVRETAAVDWLRHGLAGRMKVWYRRRPRNPARKSGNVEDFVRRVGGRYGSMVMLDADSVLEPETLVTLARRMAGDPALGLLQTVPALAGARALLPRMQQFAAATYGPTIARGVAAWQGPDGNYWGHNAIIRVRAFADACGLPSLRGRDPFGGPILSHDFAEAAWMRRGGWSVRMDPSLRGSYEDGPPTLLDLAVRDRRWMQGNLQHSKITGASGLSPFSRIHLMNGIAGYLASPAWLLLIAIGSVLSVRAMLAEHQYFVEPHQLEPHWPRFNAELMLHLFVVSLGVLLFPKLVGAVLHAWRLVRSGAWRHAAGTLASTALETLLSSLYAPILMMMQSKQLLEIVMGRDAGWSTQNRAGAATPWRQAIRRHIAHTFIGCAALWATWTYAPPLALWLSPVILGLCLSVPLSRISGSTRIGERLRHLGLFVSPDERRRVVVLEQRDGFVRQVRQACDGLTVDGVCRIREWRERHARLVDHEWSPARGMTDTPLLTAEAKCADADSLDEYLRWLDEAERLALLSNKRLMERAAGLSSGLIHASREEQIAHTVGTS